MVNSFNHWLLCTRNDISGQFRWISLCISLVLSMYLFDHLFNSSLLITFHHFDFDGLCGVEKLLNKTRMTKMSYESGFEIRVLQTIGYWGTFKKICSFHISQDGAANLPLTGGCTEVRNHCGNAGWRRLTYVNVYSCTIIVATIVNK